MKIKIVISLFCMAVNSFAQNAALLTWGESLNRLENSNFVMTRRCDDGVIDVFNFPTNGAAFGQADLKEGRNRFAVAQISTNYLGKASVTPFSGEVWVAKNSMVLIEPKTTNIFILTSTNLGRDTWALAGTNKLLLPPFDPQRYFKAMLDLQITKTNALNFQPPSP